MLVAGTAALLPSCVFDKKETATSVAQLTEDQVKLLTEIAETIIPATDLPGIPGAKATNVQEFIMVMVEDCFDKETQGKFIKGLISVNDLSEKRFDKSFIASTPEQKNELFKDLSSKHESIPKEALDFFPMMRGLTIHGYMTSQYILTEVNPYQLVPGPSKGCVAV